MRIAVLVKQIPRPSELRLIGGRLVRDGVPLEANAYCRRANARAVELVGIGGEVVVFTMGPPAAELVLREMISCGASRGVLVSDEVLAGSDTLVTAQVLAKAILREGPFDLILCGAYSIDAETGQVGVQIAQLLELPFVGPCRKLEVENERLHVQVEIDGGRRDAQVDLPAVASAAERLCSPSKASLDECTLVENALIKRLTAGDLGFDATQVGFVGSPTWVGPALRESGPRHERRRLIAGSADDALRLLEKLEGEHQVEEAVTRSVLPARAVTEPEAIWCVLDPVAEAPDVSLVAAAAEQSAQLGRQFFAVLPGDRDFAEADAGTMTDRVLLVQGSLYAEDFAACLAPRIKEEKPHAVIIEGTSWGRETAARLAALLSWGLVGEAVELTVEGDRLIAWKSAFAAQALVPVESRSPTLLVTVRPGTQAPDRLMRPHKPPVPPEIMNVSSQSRVRYGPTSGVDQHARRMARADHLVVVGRGVPPEGYPLVERLRDRLGAGPIGATRQVTDLGWLPRSRQIGLTGMSVDPHILVSVGVGGSFNHTVGTRNAGIIVAINSDPHAEIFNQCDIGLVGDWREIVHALLAQLDAQSVTQQRVETA